MTPEPISSFALYAVYPELVMAVGSMILLMVGAYGKSETSRVVSIGAIVVMLIAAVLIIGQPEGRIVAFNDMFITDAYGRFAKILILLGGIAAVLMSMDFIKRENMDRFEFPVLITIAVLGMMMMVSANSLMSLYLGLELQSLALYVIAAFNRDSARSSEAGLKYFVLGALSSGMLLYGSSLVYGFTGTVDFPQIASLLSQGDISIGFVFGLVFVLAGLAFKVSAVPFHMWTPDVYEGAPTPVTAFFAGAPKIAAMVLIIRVLFEAFPAASEQWRQVIVFTCILSMVVGSFAAIGQRNIKRLMAYSSIGHMGYALVGLAAGTEIGVRGVLVYLTIYLLTNLGVFCAILGMRREQGMVENIDDLAGISRSRPMFAAVIAMFMFSLAGIPPMAGFFAKFYVFLAAIEGGLVTLAVIGVLASVVGAFYYLRIVKVMYFDEPAEPLITPMPRELTAIMTVSALFTFPVFLFVAPPILDAAQTAAMSLIP